MQDNNDIYLIYKHVNKINGKIYVGQTCQKPNGRWKNGSGYKSYIIDKNGNKKYSYFYNAIQKYGWNNFEHKILIHGLSKEQADIWERKLIKNWNLMNSNFGYNKTEGGSRGRHSEETIEKIRQANIGKKHTENSRAKISIAKKGKKISTYHKQKIRNAHIGKHVGVLNNMYGKTGEKNKLSKKVICLDNGIIYASVSEAEAKLKIKHVSDCCNFKRKFTKGLHFVFYEYYLTMDEEEIFKIINIKEKTKFMGSDNPSSRKIVDLNTNKVYSSMVECSKYNNISTSTLINHCKNRVRFPRFMYYKD